jgi:hypothetical protein
MSEPQASEGTREFQELQQSCQINLQDIYTRLKQVEEKKPSVALCVRDALKGFNNSIAMCSQMDLSDVKAGTTSVFACLSSIIDASQPVRDLVGVISEKDPDFWVDVVVLGSVAALVYAIIVMADVTRERSQNVKDKYFK